MGQKMNAYIVLVGKQEVAKIKMDLRETEWGGLDWIHLA
jgi:hypothetical protein